MFFGLNNRYKKLGINNDQLWNQSSMSVQHQGIRQHKVGQSCNWLRHVLRQRNRKPTAISRYVFWFYQAVLKVLESPMSEGITCGHGMSQLPLLNRLQPRTVVGLLLICSIVTWYVQNKQFKKYQTFGT